MNVPGVRAGPLAAAPPQRGLALVAVLWMVSALSLLVAGLLSVSRAEIRSAQTHVAIAQAAALGDAAIQLAVLEWRTAPTPRAGLTELDLDIDGRPLHVVIQPGSGFVDLNQAPESLLVDLLQLGGGLDAEAAETLAQRVIDWRDPDDAPHPRGAEAEAYAAAGVRYRPRNGRFVVVEDLLQVLGFDYEVFDRIRGLVTVWSGSTPGGVNPRAASVPVLSILAGGDSAQAMRLAAGRNDPTLDTTMLNQAHLYAGATEVLRVEAVVALGDGVIGRRARWLKPVPDEDGAPWVTLALEPVRLSR